MSFFEKLKKGLTKTKNAVFKPIQQLFSFRKFDEDMLDDLEEILKEILLSLMTYI